MIKSSTNKDICENLPTQIPPRNTYIKFKLKNCDNYNIAKTSSKQPKIKSKNRGYVNIEEKDREPYSIDWINVENWERVLKNDNPEKESDTDNYDSTDGKPDYEINEQSYSEEQTSSEDTEYVADSENSDEDYHPPPSQKTTTSSNRKTNFDKEDDENESNIIETANINLEEDELTNTQIAEISMLEKQSESEKQYEITEKNAKVQQPKPKNKEKQSDEEDKKDDGSLEKENDDFEYAEEALTSPTLTPNQPPPKVNTTLEGKSDHEFNQGGESVPDAFMNECKMKEIVERIKRVSISRDADNDSNDKIKTKRRRIPRKGMQHKKKSEILAENEKLNEIINELTKSKRLSENKIKDLEKQLENEQKYHEKMEKLEEKLKNKDGDSLQKQIYEAEAQKHTQEKKINGMQEKIDEFKKKQTQKQTEIKELKNQNEENLKEINTLKTAWEKETDLRTKAESLLHLTKEKLEAQNILYNQVKEKNEENIKEKDDLEKNQTLKLEKYVTEISNLKLQLAEKESNLTTPNVIADNREMAVIIDKLENQIEEHKEEIHELTVKLVEANLEINIRKNLVVELNEAHHNHLEQISNAYIDKCLKYQKEAEEKAKKQSLSKKDTEEKGQKSATNTNAKDPETQEINKLREKLLERTEEVENLKTELKKIGEEKYKDIAKKTEPTPKKQGIPNTYVNGCYMIAPMHALAKCIETQNIQDNEESIPQCILKVKDCLEGNKNETEAEEVMKEIWQFSSNKWPQYTETNGIAKQEDTVEYLDRVLTSYEPFKRETETVFTRKAVCQNVNCEIVSKIERKKSNTNLIHSTHGIRKIELQEVINNHLLQEEEICKQCHETTKVSKRIEKAPNTLVVSIPRHTEEGEKINTDICFGNKDAVIDIWEKEEKLQYGIKGIIIHRGNQGLNGHYVYNHYNEKTKRWQQIDDHIITEGNNHATENKQGVVYIFRKLTKTQYTPSKMLENRETPHPKSSQQDRRPNTIKNVPCKFFKYDECREGDNCKFLHHNCEDFLDGNCDLNNYCKYRHPINKASFSNRQNRTKKNQQF